MFTRYKIYILVAVTVVAAALLFSIIRSVFFNTSTATEPIRTFSLKLVESWGPCPVDQHCGREITLSQGGILSFGGEQKKSVRVSMSDIRVLAEEAQQSGILDKKCIQSAVVDYSSLLTIEINGKNRTLQYPECENEIVLLRNRLETLLEEYSQ